MIVSRCTPVMRSIDLIEFPSLRRLRMRTFLSWDKVFIAVSFNFRLENSSNERILCLESVLVHAGMDYRACRVFVAPCRPAKKRAVLGYSKHVTHTPVPFVL